MAWRREKLESHSFHYWMFCLVDHNVYPTPTVLCQTRASNVTLSSVRISRHITMTSLRAQWRLKSPASRLFTQPLTDAQIKENTKAQRRWPL